MAVQKSYPGIVFQRHPDDALDVTGQKAGPAMQFALAVPGYDDLRQQGRGSGQARARPPEREAHVLLWPALRDVLE